MAETRRDGAPFAIPTEKALRELLGGPPGLRASIYLDVPRRPGFEEIRRFPRSYDRAVEEVRARLRGLDGIDGVEAEALLDQLAGLTPDLSSIGQGTCSIAILAGPGGPRAFSLRERAAEACHVGRSFRIRPLARSGNRDRRFRVVALTTNAVELFEGTARGLEKVELEGVPHSLQDALGSEVTDAHLQPHVSDRGGEAYVFHGHGGASRARSVDQERFYHVLARALKKAWNEREDPVVLAADRAHLGRFRKIAELPGTLSEAVAANPQGWTREKLHERALTIVHDWERRRDEEALERALADKAHGRATEELEPAAVAATSGRVSRVFVDPDARFGGHIDGADGKLAEALGDEDVLEELCGIVLARGGTAHVLGLSRDDAPRGAVVQLRG